MRPTRILLLTLCAASAHAADQAAAFFDDKTVREIRLYFDDSSWYDTLLAAHRSDPADPYFPARFESGDVKLERIGVRFKGNSSFQRNGIKKPFKLDFNEFDDSATFMGLKKLNLHNFDLAPDFMREKLLQDFAGRYVAALRSVYVRLYVNDAFYGLYLAVEQPDKRMMQSRYGNDEDGNLYEAEEQMGGGAPGVPGTIRGTTDLSYLGADQTLYENLYLLKTNEEENDYSGLIKFLDILNNTPLEELPARLETICDVENWVYAMAINNLFVNLDSYLGVAAEYYVYQRTGDNRFVHIQWDHNESFGTSGDGTPRIANPFITDIFYLPASGGGQPRPPGQPGGGAAQAARRPMLEKLWAVPDYRRAYIRAFARFIREGFNPDAMGARVTELADLIREHVAADPNKAYTLTQFETALNSQVSGAGITLYGINQFVRERYNYLRPWLDSQAAASDLRLNEVMSINQGEIVDEAGDADPWVEIHNLGPGTLDLSGYYLSDDPANPTKWALPSKKLADGEYLLLWLDEETGEGSTHAPFRPQAGGGTLILSTGQPGSNTVIDTVAYPSWTVGEAYIRRGAWGANWTSSNQPTPAAANLESAAVPTPSTGRLFINEIMADNKTTLVNPHKAGAYDDWFEIYNPGSESVDMSGMYLSDKLDNPTKWRVPDGVIVPAGGYLIFWADEATDLGALHAGFKLSASGEAISLYDKDGVTRIDSVEFPMTAADVSYGRTPDGGAAWSALTAPTPGAANPATVQ